MLISLSTARDPESWFDKVSVVTLDPRLRGMMKLVDRSFAVSTP